MNLDMVLLKTTLKNILNETVGVSGAIVRVELEVGEFWTFVYFESTLPEAHDISEKILASLRLRMRFRGAGKYKSTSHWTTFHKYPSAEKRVEGVSIFESMVSNAGTRPGSSGAQYTYTRDSAIAEKSLKSASHYLGRVGSIVFQASALRDKMRGVDAKEKDGYCHERVVWVKYDGDRLSRQMVTTFDIL